MKKYIIIIAWLINAANVYAGDVTLAWDPVTDPDLDHYTLYQADRFEDKTGPWKWVCDIEATTETVVVTVDSQKNFAWYVTASDKAGNETGPSNMVELYDHTAPANPSNLRKSE